MLLCTCFWFLNIFLLNLNISCAVILIWNVFCKLNCCIRLLHINFFIKTPWFSRWLLKISILHGPSCLKIFSAILFWLTILLNLPLKSIKKPSKSGAEWNTVGPPPRAIWLDRSQNFIRAVLFSDYVCICQIKLTQKILTDSSSYCFIIKKKTIVIHLSKSLRALYRVFDNMG